MLTIFTLIVVWFSITFTLNQDVFLSTWLVFFFIFIYCLFKFGFSNIIIIIKYILLWLSWFLIVSISYRFTNISYSKNISSLDPKRYYWTWLIVDNLEKWKYLFKDYEWRIFIYNSDNKYIPWDKIYTFASARLWNKDPFNSKLNIIGSWFDYQKWFLMKWYYGYLYETKSINLWNFENELSSLQKIRKYIKQIVLDTYWENKLSGLILWMLIWDKSFIPEDNYDSFINSWLVHIVAVSWSNILMIVVFLSFVLIFIPFYPRLIIILLVITFYSFVCGMDSSIFRAWIMWGLSIIALFLGRNINIRRSICYSLIIMLIRNPYFFIYDMWFLLSFSALAWIVIFDNFIKWFVFETSKSKSYSNFSVFIQKIKKGWFKLFKNYLAPTLWASIWVLSILIYFVWKINLITIIANILVLPILPFVMIYWFISLLLHSFLPFEFLLLPERIFIDYIYGISNFFDSNWIYLIVDNFYAKLFLAIWVFFLILYLAFRSSDS